MNCSEVEEQEIIEHYLTSKLSNEDAEAFEEHYLGCKRCFDELQLRHALAIELGSQAAVPSAAAPVRWSFRWGWGLAAAAVLLLSFVSVMVLQRRPTQQFSQNALAPVDGREVIIARLAVIDTAPSYVPLTIRGGKTVLALEKFQQGMQRYTEHDYAGAIVLLRQASELDSSHEPTLFYLGISCLMTHQLDEAIAQLSILTMHKSGPYKEESHWYLAKAYFGKKDLVKGQRELEAVVPLNGLHQSEARQALRLLAQAGGPRG